MGRVRAAESIGFPSGKVAGRCHGHHAKLRRILVVHVRLLRK